ITFIIFISLTPAAGAQSVRTMTVVPPSISLHADPGDTSEGTLKIINDSDETITFNAVMRDYTVNDTHGTPVVLPPNALSNKYSAANWVGVSPTTFTIAPRTRQELDYFIQIPRDAKPGGHYPPVVYTPVITAKTQGSGALIDSQIRTL